MLSWKHRALVVQPGLRVLGHYVHEGEKSKAPLCGTIVAYYPGLTVVDFDPVLGDADFTTKRQTVPQDWIVLAASHKTIRDVMSEMISARKMTDTKLPLGSHSKGRNLWQIAKHKVWERIVLAHRH